MSPDDAFKAAKSNFEQAIKNVNDFIDIIKNAENFNAYKAKDKVRFEGILEKFHLQNISSFEEAVKAKENYENIVNNFNRYRDFVTIELAHKGIKIKKGKFEVVQQEDVDNKEQDDTEDVSLANEEISKERFDRSIFETNPRDTASVRVKALIQTIRQMKYDEKTDTYSPEFEMGISLYADGDDVFLDMLEAGIAMDLSGYTNTSSKLNAFRNELGKRQKARPYLNDLLSKINKYEKLGQWDKLNDILTVASKAFANETLVLYTLNKVGSQIKSVKLVKVIASNRDTVEGQVSRDWLTRHMVSGFYDKTADGKLMLNADKVAQLNKIRIEGKSATGDAQIRKFIEYFDLLGIKFTDKDLKYIAPILHKKDNLNKGKNFGAVFNDGNLLDNIYKSFLKNMNEPFEGQYGFQDEKKDMKVLANLYNDANPGLYKPASSKTADNKSKYLYIQPNYVEVAKREFDNGNTASVTNTALAKPNQSFWTKVKNEIYKFVIGYFNGSREQAAGKDGKVRKNFTEKEQVVIGMFMKHQENMNDGTYITFTLSDKTTTMETKITKEFFVDTENNPVGKGEDFAIKNGRIEYTPKLKDKVYNSFVEPEISRILAAMKHSDKVNLENYDIASKLFYFFPVLNSNPSLENFRKDLYSGKKTIEDLNKQYGQAVADVVLSEFDAANDEQVKYLLDNKIIEKEKGVYTFPLFSKNYVNRFREASIPNELLPKLMALDMQLNYQNAQIKTVQFLKFDPAHAFKTYKGFDKSKSFEALTSEEKVKLVNASWDDFSKRAASLIAPGGQGNWAWEYDIKFNEKGKKISSKKYNTQTYRAVTLKDVKRNIAKYKDVETTDAQEFVTMQEHIDYLMSQGKLPSAVWESIHAKIVKAGPGGYYELNPKELGYVFSPTKPVYVNSAKEGEDTGLNRFDYIKSSRYPLIPQHEAGSERDKLRIWMEKNNVQSANFGSGKKLGRPSVSLEVFDKDNNFIEPKDFDKSIQELSRDGLRNQQEIPHQKDEIANVSQMNRTLFDGLLKSTFTFSGMKNVTGGELKTLKEAIRARQFQLKANELTKKLGGSVWKSERGLYELLRQEILNDTTGSYTENDLKSIELDDDDMFRIPLEAQFKFPKFQGLVNSMINNNVKLKVEGTSFVQVSAVGAKFTFGDLSEGVKSDIIWTDSYAKQFKKGKEATLKYVEKKGDVVSPAQVIVSQYIRDGKGNLIDLSKFITEKDINGTTVKILDTSKMSEDLFQLVASRIPNQSHVSTLPIEVVGFLPSYMENTIIVPDGITGQMGSDFDVDKLFAYTSKVVENTDEEGNTTYSPVEYSINSIEDVSKLNDDQLGQAYRDLHWNVLTHPDTFDKITKSVDNPEVGDKKEEREQQLKKYKIDTTQSSNLPLDFMTSIRRFTDNKSGKDGVSIFANLISAQADMQDKILTLGTKDKDGNSSPLPITIRLSKNAVDVVDLLYVGQTGESTSFLGKKRSISDNLNIEFTESVDNAKNQNLSAFNWDNKSMGAVGFLSMLTDQQGQAIPIEFMMDLTSQSTIKRLLTLIDLKQDSFGTYDSKAILNSIDEIKKELIGEINKGNLLKPGETGESYFDAKLNPGRNKILDPQTLADMWIVGQAIQQKDAQKVKESLESIRKDLNAKYGDIYKSVDDLLLDYYNTQYNSLDLYYDVEQKGRELMTILGVVYPYTKGIGSNMFDTKQKLNQLNKLADSSNFIGIENLAGEVEKDKDTGRITIIPKGELGAAIRHSLMVAQDMYAKIFPIASGKKLEDIVVKILENQGLKIDDISKNKYSSTFENIFYSAIDFLYTSPDLELFDNAKEIRNRLINGDTSIGKRIVDLKEKPEFAKNGFLKYIEVNAVNNSDAYTIAFKDPFGTNVNEKSVVSGFYELAISDNEEVRQLAKDIAVYTYATGDAGNIGRFIPIDYYLRDKDYAKAIKKIRGTFVDSMSDAVNREALIDQIVQNNPEEFAKKFNYSSSIGQNGDTDNTFKKILKPLLKGASTLEKVSKFSLKLGDFLADEKAEGIANSLQIPLSDSEITAAKLDGLDVYKVDDKGNPILDGNGKAIPKSKYPPYILITDSYEGIDYFSSRTADYLYKRTSKALTADGIATYERINILGVGNIKEFEFNNPELTSVIKNNNVDGIDVSMLPDEVDMSFGLTKDMFEDYSTGTIEPKGEKVKDGVYVNQEGLTKEEQLELFDFLKPILEKQAIRSNTGANAPKMAGLELNWDYIRNRPNQKRVDVKGSLRPNNTYGWFEESANGLPLEKMTPRFKELMSKAVGIDVSNYDGSIVNIYNDDSFISNHPDIDESKTAEKYPVVVANIGGTGNIVLGTDKANDSRSLKAGAGYLFGFQGKNRTIPHSTYASSTQGFLPAITTEIDGETYPAGSYRISITMRRVMPLEPGMPSEPAVIGGIKPTGKSVADVPQNKVSGIESYGSTVTANAEAIKALGANPHSIDMIEAGFRTRTTRSDSEMKKYAVKVGDVIKHFGKSADDTTKTIYAKVTAIHPKGTEGWKGTWAKEGWRAEDVDVIDRMKDGAAAIEFEVIKPEQAGGTKVDNTNKSEFNKLPGKSATPTMTYAGIGSRETPQEILDLMTKAAEYLDGLGYTLRSGAADGADTAFEKGATKKEIFKGFDPAGETEVKIAHEIHPDLKGAMNASKNKKIKAKLAEGATQQEAEKSGERSAWAVQNLMARNTNQVFGKNLDSSVDFVLFYAKETDNPLRPKGGTGQAVEMARRKGIPTINMADANWRDQLSAVIKKTSTKEKGNKINIYSTDKNGFQDLSNFAVRPFTFIVQQNNNGDYAGRKEFQSVEQAYQWHKVQYADPVGMGGKSRNAIAKEILSTTNGAKLRELGREFYLTKFKDRWDRVSSTIMKDLLSDSFKQNPEAAAKLLSTEDAELTHTQDNSKWKTEFPKLLMEVREELKSVKPSIDEEPITVDYGGKTYILEGSEEDGFNIYYTAKGQKSKLVEDNSLVNKVTLAHAVNLYPERVVTLKDMQYQPSYYVDFTNRIVSLAPSNYGGEITSGAIYDKVMSVFKNEKLTPVQDEPVAKNPEVVKYEPNYIEVNGRKIETFKWDKDKKVAITLTADQKKAVKLMVDHFTSKPGVPYILKGKAGTGKTTVIRVINEYFKGKSSVITTPTHKAGKNASIVTYGNTQDKYKTYAATYSGYRAAPKEDILIFDEISMLNDSDLEKVIKKITPKQIVIFMGDQRQLPPVKASKTSAFFNSKDSSNVYELTEVMRFDEQGSIFKIANQYAENLKKYDVIKQFPSKLISDKDAVYTVDSSKRLIDAYMHYYRLEGNDPSKVRLIVYGNKTAELYNNQIRNIIYKGDAQFGVINNNDLLTGNAGWSTKNVLQSPMVNSSEYKVVEDPRIVKRSYGEFSFIGQNITFKEIVSGEFEAERNITVVDPANSENKSLYNHIACNIINMKNMSSSMKYESRYNEELNRIEKSGIYSLTTMYAKPSAIDPRTKEVLSVDLYTLEQLLTIIKKENPELSEDEALNMIDSEVVKQYYKIEPNVSFGYAITTHKSQGSTYKHVLVDEANMSFRDKTRRVDDQNDEFYAYEANQMRYVAFSRPTTTLVIYTKKAIGETLEYNEGDSSNLTEEQPTNIERIDIFSLFQGTMVDDVTTEVFGSSSSRLDARAVLNKIYTEGDTLSKNILNLIGKTGGFGGLRIVVDENLDSHGKYLNGVITINPTETIGSTDNQKLAKKRLHDVIVHELLHHITSTLLLDTNLSKLTAEQKKWVTSLKNLFSTVRNKFLNDPKHKEALLNAIDQASRNDGFLSENDKSMYYGLTSVDDFVSMLMTDEGFRELMNNTKYEGNKSMLDRFIDILTKILESLGIQIKDESVLKEGVTNIVGLIQSRNEDMQAEQNPTLKSISTAKEDMIADNFEEILNILNIKSEC